MAQHTVDQIKKSVRIEEVAGRYIKLSRRGKLFTGLCPFHDDHHPSLTVDAQKQTFVCYACGEHGDVIAFVQKAEKCSFAEAMEKLKIENGALKMNKRKEKLVDRNTEAKQFSTFNSQLSIEKNLQFLSSLFPYACGDSELTPAYLDFEVGVSPAMVPKEWHRMRRRIVFPIRDEMGQLIAFAARRQSGDNPDEPKYINTSVDEGYRKSEHLYALHRAKLAIAKEGFAFVVEGYKDAIAMHAAGFRNTVALCGTALCKGHVALLKKYTSQVTVLLDADRAGLKAAAEAVAILRCGGIWAVRGCLPDGEDPDSLFRLQGMERFVSFILGMQKALFSTDEVALFNRISKQVWQLMHKHDAAADRDVLLNGLATMLAHRVGLSLRDGWPSTSDWRWL